jgi:hypothetical protein
VERSLNGKIWNKIGTVASHGESTVFLDYAYVDKAPLSGVNLYRLKMVDKDNTFAYSSIREVKFSDGPAIATYPNPVSDKLLVNSYAKVKEVSVKNASGVNVLQQQKISDNGIDVSRLVPGIYLVTLTLFDGTISTHKVAVTR